MGVRLPKVYILDPLQRLITSKGRGFSRTIPHFPPVFHQSSFTGIPVFPRAPAPNPQPLNRSIHHVPES